MRKKKTNPHAFSSGYGYLMRISPLKYYYLGIGIWNRGTKDRRNKKREKRKCSVTKTGNSVQLDCKTQIWLN